MIMGLVKKGKREGVWKMNFKNGEVLKENYSNGQKKWRISYLNGIKNGLSTFWYENGKKWKEGNYSKGDSVGEWVFWDETGRMIDKKQYRNFKKPLDFNSRAYIYKQDR